MALYQDVNVKRAAITGSTTALEVVAAVTGKKIKVLSYLLIQKTADDVLWRSGDTTTGNLTGVLGFQDGGGARVNDSGTPGHEDLVTNAGEALNLICTTGNTVGGNLSYHEEA